MLKLITCDVDGTLLKNYNDDINTKLFEVIDKFLQKDVFFSVASGRQLWDLKRLFKPVGDKIGYIAENGSLVEYKNKIIYKSKMDLELYRKLAKKVLDIDEVELFLCAETTTYMIPRNKELYKHIGKEINNHLTEIKTLEEIKEDIVKISIFFKDGVDENIVKILVSEFGQVFKHCKSDKLWYDFMAKNTHKGTAIEFLQQKLGITKEQTASFGDNFNDIEMLRDSKYSYAMEDAHQDVKKVSRYICKDVVESLEELYKEMFEN